MVGELLHQSSQHNTLVTCSTLLVCDTLVISVLYCDALLLLWHVVSVHIEAISY